MCSCNVCVCVCVCVSDRERPPELQDEVGSACPLLKQTGEGKRDGFHGPQRSVGVMLLTVLYMKRGWSI